MEQDEHFELVKTTKSFITYTHVTCGRATRISFENCAKKGVVCRDCVAEGVSRKIKDELSEFLDLGLPEYGETYELIKFNGWDRHAKFICKTCGNVDYFSPKWVLDKNDLHRCKYCTVMSFYSIKTHQAYLTEIDRKYEGMITVLGEYTRCYIPILHRNNGNGIDFMATPSNVLEGSSLGVKRSKGEALIHYYLKSSGISYHAEYALEDCRNNRPLPFDFAVFSDCQQLKPEYLIEFDGEQHYKPVEFWGGQEQFEKQQLHDRIKDDYCEQQGIPLIRIPYWEIDNIEQILSKELAPLLEKKAS